MESGQSLQRRIRSVKNIGQITKAMELVAATKMRRSQEAALNSRPYAYAALELLGLLSKMEDVPMPELLKARPVEKTAFLLMTSDKGLAGSFNGAVIRRFESYIRENGIDIHDPRYSFVAIGQKAKTYLERKGVNVILAFIRVGDLMKMKDADPIASALIEGYVNHEFDSVMAFFTTFVTALRQDAVVREFLPISYEKIKESIEETIPRAGRYSEYAKSESFFDEKDLKFIIEPAPAQVLAELAPQLLKIRIYHMILEANASEHSARRVAMKNASDNASDLGETLNVVYNKQRQAAITNQIIEVTSGTTAVN
ncbi:MAG TPA: ATP synthase F1 subunit gamma [Candidatus Paceibacterota bacterium]|nr:ATP synthase F1 subunit gamma [Candidatus Paceibacterota bacterium]